MSPSDHTPEQGDCGADAAAYVLGALESHEAEAFRRHLATCAICRDEVATLGAIADSLSAAPPQVRPPRRLKRKIMASIRKEPKTGGVAGGRRLRPAPSRPALAVGVALLIAAAIVGGIELSSNGSGGTRVVRAHVVAAAGSALVRLTSGHAELIVERFPAPPAGKIYEVWLKRDGQAPSPTSALFSVTSTGAGAVDVPGDIRGVSEVLVTPEPLGGSPAPTHAPVIVAKLG